MLCENIVEVVADENNANIQLGDFILMCNQILRVNIKRNTWKSSEQSIFRAQGS